VKILVIYHKPDNDSICKSMNDRIFKKINNIQIILPFFTAILATAVRLWCIRYSDLPAGDEINSYIYNAQRFASSLSLPGLDNFPLTAVVYGVLIQIIDHWTITLSGVVARNIVIILAGILCTYFIFQGVKIISGKRPATIAAAIIACFPGTFFAFRADISLYYILMPFLSFSLVLLTVKPRYSRAILPGVIGALFYMSRSDGLFIFILSTSLFTLYYRNLWKMSVVAIMAFVFTMGCFWGYEYCKQGHLSGGAGERAVAAFYQAEGLVDNKGGSWHDYTQRGLDRFGPQDQYKDRFFLLAAKNLDAVFERVGVNLKVIENYCTEISLPIWLIGVLILAALLGRYRKVAIFFSFPCIATSCIYLAFYYQTSYFTILSYGLAICVAIGVLTVFEIIVTFTPWVIKKPHLTEPLLLLPLIVFFIYQATELYPQRRTSVDRYWDALSLIKAICPKSSLNCFFNTPYGGSRCMPIFVNLPFQTVDYDPLAAKPQDEQRAFLRQNGFKYLLTASEYKDLWQPDPAGEDLIYVNNDGDVKIVSLSLEDEFNKSTSTYFTITSSTQPSAIVPAQQTTLDIENDWIVIETLGEDPFVFLPSVQTLDSSILAVKVSLWSPIKTSLKLYYKSQSNPGFHEQRSVEKILQKGMNIILFSLPVGKNNFVNLRMDPGTKAGKFKLYSLVARAI
jgi:hypothetical protein